MQLSDYIFLGTTESLCPECRDVVPTKIVSREGRVYFRKRCKTCGPREDFICSDVTYYDRLEYAVPSKIPKQYGIEPNKGCPYDCGLCTEHEQHTCIALVELTSNCNLKCPMCFASSGPGGKHLSLEDCKKSIDRIVETEGRAEVIQLSGGEPTIHPQFNEIFEYAVSQDVDYVQINTNGIRLSKDEKLLDLIASKKGRVECFFQFDGLTDDVYEKLRGEKLLDMKLRAIEKMGEADIHTTLAVTLQSGVNEDQIGQIVEFGLARPWITGINFQPATYSGRHFLPEELENRITFPDVIKAIASGTNGKYQTQDFMPLPCAHPNCHQICIAYRQPEKDRVTPLTRFIEARPNLDLLANGISFTRENSEKIIIDLINRVGCCPSGECGDSSQQSLGGFGDVPVTIDANENEYAKVATEFFTAAISDQLGAKDLFRITITNFLDVYNFDLRRLMKCCTHHVLPSGHLIPFCAYNVLYRDGHVELPELTKIEPPISTKPSPLVVLNEGQEKI